MTSKVDKDKLQNDAPWDLAIRGTNTGDGQPQDRQEIAHDHRQGEQRTERDHDGHRRHSSAFPTRNEARATASARTTASGNSVFAESHATVDMRQPPNVGSDGRPIHTTGHPKKEQAGRQKRRSKKGRAKQDQQEAQRGQDFEDSDGWYTEDGKSSF
ncbi:hypothetical protein LTR10_023734 [Elasticomyces elasticus]|uniref:Hypervirulence associated protein TUDOR domain-containing protein n=1 Tax=Exophiala sideris TaxID=1016849 RepID=A0ABR0J1G3_9EURO|nr:hypothetical protein LTR10_023734 [Elasticomyces elasticus]KAK5023588.1 hypothetical protein LTS07_009096 [Exophiala sideris]KAK5029588.1 hypothetical protein LTR13_008508 [Exophiala sideris]KAK5053377.1 hypothetical protein LTR69_009335 [Exophiala sideris]KAK5179135.1 hypothetical protein LTR44_008289 [Eurotiomycetes sp. CCFEE 6388]